MMNSTSHSIRRRQRGNALFFSLMALVLLSLAAVGLVRSVSTGTLIAGNLGFKRDATLSAASGAEEAMTWLHTMITSNPIALNGDDASNAYFASALDNLDATGNATSSANPLRVVNWDGTACKNLDPNSYSACDVKPRAGTTVNGNQVQWVITRICDFADSEPVRKDGTSNFCAKPQPKLGAGSSDKGTLPGGARIVPIVASPYFRIVTRVEGPRNTVSFVETIVHF